MNLNNDEFFEGKVSYTTTYEPKEYTYTTVDSGTSAYDPNEVARLLDDLKGKTWTGGGTSAANDSWHYGKLQPVDEFDPFSGDPDVEHSGFLGSFSDGPKEHFLKLIMVKSGYSNHGYRFYHYVFQTRNAEQVSVFTNESPNHYNLNIDIGDCIILRGSIKEYRVSYLNGEEEAVLKGVKFLGNKGTKANPKDEAI